MVPSLAASRHVVATAKVCVNVQHCGVWMQFDALEFAGPQARCWEIARWTPSESAHAGWADLTAPTTLATTVALMDAGCPALVVMTQLLRQGWIPVQNAVVDDPSHPAERQVCDRRTPAASTFYFQCLVAWENISAIVPAQMPSGQPQLYYRLPLAGRVAAPYLCDKEYTRLWKEGAEALPIEDDGGGEVLALPPRMPPRPLALPGPPPGRFLARRGRPWRTRPR